jgi:hypothetical protein
MPNDPVAYRLICADGNGQRHGIQWTAREAEEMRMLCDEEMGVERSPCIQFRSTPHAIEPLVPQKEASRD